MITLDKKMKQVGAARRRRIEARVATLVSEEMSLRDLRRAHRLTQAKLAKSLGMSQDQISRLEQRSDLLLSTLTRYVESMGGSLSLVAEFPDRAPVALTGIGGVEATASHVTPRRRVRK